MLENLLIVLGIIVVGAVGLRTMRSRQLSNANQRISTQDPLLENLQPGRAAILYFTADWCSACKLQQRPAILDLQAQLGDTVQVLQIDVDARPEDAKRWGVMSLPTTYILAPNGEATAVNYGVASVQKLKQQLEG
jgi:thiol:disulfide interchange protein